MAHHMAQETTTPASAVSNRPLRASDLVAVTALHDKVFGPGRFARTAYRVREGTPPICAFCRGAFAGDRLLACVRLTVIAIGDSRPHLLLGPLAVEPDVQGQGFGKALVAETVEAAMAGGIGVIALVGDVPYYGRFGFAPVPPGQIEFPGPVNQARVLAREIKPGALAAARGMVRAI
jgi:predicted N-acetyltransferase YhbS